MKTYEPLKFLGRLTLVPLRMAKTAPWLSFAHTWEVDGEHRHAPTVIFRAGPFGLGIGLWLDTDIESLRAEKERREQETAEQVAYDTYQAVNGPIARERFNRIRKEIAKLGLGPDEEMALMQERGVFGE